MGDHLASPRIVVVAADPLVRSSLSRELMDRGRGVVVADESYETLDEIALQQSGVDAFLFDLGWGEEEYTDLELSPYLERISQVVEIGCGVVVLASNDMQASLAWRVGAHSILSRQANITQIETALLAAVDHLLTLDPVFKDRLLPIIMNDESENLEPLTARELEVLRLVAEGLPNKTIASKLNVSEHTVKFHVNSILRKLDAQSRTEAATIALRRGLLLV